MVKPHDKAAEVTRVDGEILIDGPDGMTTSLTPEAALKTARRLEDKAVEAIIAQHGGEEEDATDRPTGATS